VDIRSFVALGDSFTEGLEDELGPSGRHLGWADRVAAALAKRDGALRDANLAVRGRVLAEVVAQQVPAALALAPDVLSFHAGANDVLRPRVDVAAVVVSYDRAVEQLVAEGRDVVLFTVIERVGGTGRTADRLAARFAAFNRGVRDTAARHGCLLVDAGAVPGMQDRRLWHEDRLHLAPEGHARIAAAVLEAMGVEDDGLLGGEPGWWREPLAPGARPRRRAELVSDVRWVRRHLIPWIGRRVRGVSSGDTVVPKHIELVDVVRDDSSR
jgi:lysophospholipase L1-like esterase